MELKPILFNTEMVKAILDGRKTVTRRVMKPRNAVKAKRCGYCQGNGLWVDNEMNERDKDTYIKDYSVSSCWIKTQIYIQKYAPYHPGDILYVRETWYQTPDGRYWYKADNICQGCTELGECIPKGVQNHKTCKLCEYLCGHDFIKWRPSIHMPKEAARLFLRVTDVKVERLQDCGNMQAKDEGCTCCSQFARLWDDTIQPKDRPLYGWEANPWVWVIEFEKIRREEVRQ